MPAQPSRPKLRVNRLVGISGRPVMLESPIEFATAAHASNLFGLAWASRVVVADQTARLAMAKAGKYDGQLVEQTSPRQLYVIVDVDFLESGTPASAFEELVTTVQGSTGTPGTPGTPGTNGTNGKTILSGSSDPGSGTGTDGDFYVKLPALVFFGPKASGAWPSGIAMRPGWSLKSTTYTAATGEKILAETAGGAFTLSLPPSPSTGDGVQMAPGSTWETNHLTVSGNGHNIESASTLVCDEDAALEVVFNGTIWKLFYRP